MSENPHLSPSQLDTFCRCGEQYRRRYIERDRIPPGFAIIRGTGVHESARENFRQKMETHRDLSADKLVEAAVAKFEAETEKGYTLTGDEQARGASIVIGQAKDETAQLARKFAEEAAPEYQPVLVETPVRIEIPASSVDLLGFVDLVAEPGGLTTVARRAALRAWGRVPKMVVDFKTAGKKKSQDEADRSPQLTFYSAATALHFGLPPEEVRLDVLIQGKRGASRQVLKSRRGEADYNALSARVDSVLRAIRAGVFTPATPGAWWCSPKWCGYWNTCPYVNAEREALAQIGGGG